MIWTELVVADTCTHPPLPQGLDGATEWLKTRSIMALSEVYWDRQIPLPKLAPIQAKGAVALVALLCFINSYDGEFVFDDSEAIVNNKVFFFIL